MNGLSADDRSHLETLSVLHYVYAALGVLGLVFLAMHFAFMRAVVTLGAQAPQGTPMPAAVETMIFAMYAVFAVLLAAGSVLNLLAARWLRRCRHHAFCVVVSALNVLQVPLGTVLGVFTLLVLSRERVKRAFA